MAKTTSRLCCSVKSYIHCKVCDQRFCYEHWQTDNKHFSGIAGWLCQEKRTRLHCRALSKDTYQFIKWNRDDTPLYPADKLSDSRITIIGRNDEYAVRRIVRHPV